MKLVPKKNRTRNDLRTMVNETQAIAIQNSKWCSVWLNKAIAISYPSTELCKLKEFLTQHGNQPSYKYFTDVRHNLSQKRKATTCLLTSLTNTL